MNALPPRFRLVSAYVLALGAALLIYALCRSVEGALHGSVPLSLFILAVIPAAWFGGAGPGLVATIASVFLAQSIIASQGVGAAEQLARLAVIGLIGLVISLLAGTARRSRAGLRAERARLAALLDNLPAGAMLAEAPSGRIVLANRSVKDILGHSFDTPDVTAYGKWKTLGADGKPLAPGDHALARALRGESIHGREYRYRHEEGREIWLRVSAAPVQGPNERIAGAVLLFWDIDREKRLAEELHMQGERLRLAQTAARVGTFDWNIATDQIYWSPEIEALYGVPPGAFEGSYDHWRRRVHPEDIARAELDVQRALEQGAFHSNWRALLPDGGVRHLEAFARVFFDERQRPHRMLGVNVDVTAQREAQQDLRAVRTHLEHALEAGRLGAWHLDLATGKMSCTPGCKANFGRSPGDPFDYPDFLAAVHEDDRGKVKAAVRRAVEHRESYRAEYRARWPDGSVHWIAARGEAHYDADGKPLAMDGVTADVTERRALEERLRAHADELRDADHRKDRFLAMLSHELRSPLQAIGAAVQVLRQSSRDADAAARAAGVIARQTDQIGHLVDDLLEVARIAEGKLRLDKRTIDAAEIISAAAETMRPQLERRRQTLRVDVPAGALPVSGDPARLTQVLVNLLGNASKYTPEGGAISIGAEARDGTTAIRVRDSGIGIPPHMLSKVFDVFTQVEEHRAHAAGGLGIGLNVVQRLVDLHGGSVAAHSDGPGKGSEFVVRLPQADAEERQPASSSSPSR